MRGCSNLGWGFSLLFTSLVGIPLFAAVLIEDNGAKKSFKANSEIQSVMRMRPQETFQSLFELRQKRRMGIGASFLGRSGLVGLDFELNLHPQHSILTSVGGGPGYTAMATGYRWIALDGQWSPNLGFSMAGWRGDRRQMASEGSIPEFFAQKGEVGVASVQNVYLIPSVGIEKVQISGEGVGGAIFAEALFFVRIPSLEVRPLGTVGARYYF